MWTFQPTILGRWDRRPCNTDILELHQIADQCLNCVTTGWLFLNCRLQPPIKENRWPPIKIANATIDASSFKITSSLSPLILIALSLGCPKFYVFWNSSLIVLLSAQVKGAGSFHIHRKTMRELCILAVLGVRERPNLAQNLVTHRHWWKNISRAMTLPL